MTGKTERVILIKGDATKWYNQAIFIVNQGTPQEKMPVNFVAEAEKIINSYLERERTKSLPKGQAVVGTVSAPAALAVPAPRANVPAKAAEQHKNKKSGKKIDFILNMMIVVACTAIVALFVYGILL